MSHSRLYRLSASLALLPLALAVALGGLPAPPAYASAHSLTLAPSDAAWGGESFGNLGADCASPSVFQMPRLDDSTLRVGYAHMAFSNPFPLPDDYSDCVYQTELRFDLSALQQYPGSILTHATLTYTDKLYDLDGPDGETIFEPYGILENDVHGSCISEARVPTDDWRGWPGLISFSTPDEALTRTGLATWDVTNRARQWYAYPNANRGLLLTGFDEGRGFSNNARCVSSVTNVQLQVDFVADDAAAAAPPIVVLGDSNKFGLIPPAGMAAAPLPPPPPSLPDLLIAKVEVKGKNQKQANNCDPGDNTVSVTIGNIGYAPVGAFEVDLWVDGKPRGHKTPVALDNGKELTVVFSKIKVDKGSHVFAVNVDPESKVSELDKTNNNYSDARACT